MPNAKETFLIVLVAVNLGCLAILSAAMLAVTAEAFHARAAAALPAAGLVRRQPNQLRHFSSKFVELKRLFDKGHATRFERIGSFVLHDVGRQRRHRDFRDIRVVGRLDHPSHLEAVEPGNV